jgi:hypothetical protein
MARPALSLRVRSQFDHDATPEVAPCVAVALELGGRAFWVPMLRGGRIPETEAWARRVAACLGVLRGLSTDDLEHVARLRGRRRLAGLEQLCADAAGVLDDEEA